MKSTAALLGLTVLLGGGLWLFSMNQGVEQPTIVAAAPPIALSDAESTSSAPPINWESYEAPSSKSIELIVEGDSVTSKEFEAALGVDLSHINAMGLGEPIGYFVVQDVSADFGRILFENSVQLQYFTPEYPKTDWDVIPEASGFRNREGAVIQRTSHGRISGSEALLMQSGSQSTALHGQIVQPALVAWRVSGGGEWVLRSPKATLDELVRAAESLNAE
ncbi:MAG: hypothetical protein KJ747_08615 [Actinobacteria bacterium]|nr:hypothetical protein [Actinomycetota bacterium]